MKFLKYFLIFLIIIVTIIGGYFLYLRSSLTPTYNGKISLKGINNDVETYFTEYGIPHIYANSQKDAYYTFGYIHAQDRLWQMDVLRRVGGGRLSEIFGKDLVPVDTYLRTMGINSYAEKAAKEYINRDHPSLSLVQAYLDGINSYIANKPKPLEHKILGIEVEPFEVVNIFQAMTYMSFSFQNAQKTDPFLTELSSLLDSAYLADLSIYNYPGETVTRNFDDRYSQLTQTVAKVVSQLPVPEFIGSNSWVVDGSKTTTGKVILVNDPHIGFTQPSVWYEAHLNMPEREYYGYHIAGVPFPLIFHTTSHANGLTMFENDDMDFYVEEIHPEDSNKYRYKGEWLGIINREETIAVKNEASVKIQIRQTAHGPIVSDIIAQQSLEDVVSMHWVTTAYPNYFIELLNSWLDATDIEAFEKGAALIHGPGLNVMYGDSSGNIAWWASAKLPKRRDERTSKTFYDGSIGLDDPDSSYTFSENPHAINPPWGYVRTANNQPDSVNGVVYSGYYLPDDRAERITELLESKAQFSVEDMKAMTGDIQSKTFMSIKGILLHAIKDTEESALLSSLIKWKCNMDAEDYRPLIYQKWLYEILEATMKDEMGDSLWLTYQETHTYKVAIENLVKNADSKWWDNITTDEKESRADIIRSAFEKSLSDLRTQWGDDFTKWRWSEAHQVTHNHFMGSQLSFLNVGPFSSAGGNEVLNNMGYTYTGEQLQPVLFGPSTRRIIDFSDVRNNSWSILPTGQSGNIFSPYYEDQAQMFINGEFRKMMMNHEEIKSSENRLVLKSK